MIVYVDLIFLLNVLIDGLILQTTAWSRQIKTHLWRIVIASVIGASYVVMMFVPSMSFAFTLLIKMLVSLLMVYVAYGFGSVHFFVRNLAAFYIINFVAAGCIIATNFFLQSTHDVFNGILFTQSGGLSYELKIGSLLIIIILPISLLLYRHVFTEKQQQALLGDCLTETVISIDEHVLTCVGLIDTGNQLVDPISRHPVIVMDAGLWSKLLTSDWVSLIHQADDDQLFKVAANMPSSWQKRLRIIPFRGINKGAHFILALKPDKVVIKHNEQVYETNDVWIGLSGNKLCMDESYQAIIHPAITNMSRR